MVAASIILTSALIVYPQYKKIVASRNYQNSQIKSLEDGKVKLDILKNLQDHFSAANRADLERLNIFLPKEKDIPGLLLELQAIATQDNFTIVSLDVAEEKVLANSSETPAEGNISKLNIALNLKDGTYSDFKNLLRDLENNLRLIDTVSFNISPETDSYSMNLRTYYLKN